MNLIELGLTPKEAQFYSELLLHGPCTARTLSVQTGEQRTNCYLILDSLAARGLIQRDDTKPVAYFQAKHPEHLKQLLIDQQQLIKNVSLELTRSMPELASLYRLTTKKQGLAYFQGIRGYGAMLDDMNNTHEALSFISETIFQYQPRLRGLLEKKMKERAKNKAILRFLACGASKPFLQTPYFRQPHIEVRATTADLFDGEISIYDNKVALTTYARKELTTLVITDNAQAQTFRAIFELVWQNCEPPRL